MIKKQSCYLKGRQCPLSKLNRDDLYKFRQHINTALNCIKFTTQRIVSDEIHLLNLKKLGGNFNKGQKTCMRLGAKLRELEYNTTMNESTNITR